MTDNSPTRAPPSKKSRTYMEEENVNMEIDASMDAKTLNRFSRQNAALGAETTAKLIKMAILVVGVRGIGIETIKNLALQGAGAITIIDTNLAEIKDCGVNFFIHESDIGTGKSRADIIAPRVRELNPICKVLTSSVLNDDIIRQHSAVVITQVMPTNEIIRMNELCRSLGIAFFYAFSGGITASVFVDHGDNHYVVDPNGEKPLQKLITSITQLEKGVCRIRYDHPEGQLPISLSDNHYEITEVNGIDDINGLVLEGTRQHSDPVMTLRFPYDIPAMSEYAVGGLLTEKKLPKHYPMQSFAAKIKDPGNTFAEPPTLCLTDLLNFGSELQNHVAFVATLRFYDINQRLPTPNSKEDAESVVKLAQSLLTSGDIKLDDFELNVDLVYKYALYAGAELQPMAAFIGGVLAQEVVKCTGKFTPLPGFLHFSTPESLPSEAPSQDDTKPRGHRNDELASVFGWSFIETLGNLNYFMVGCGALGCEFMKNFALNNIFCGPRGKLFVTDADRIELSNLTRQFLFREHNVGQPKSKAAAAMATVMNKDIKVEALELFVGPKTEDAFNDDFWINLDGVCNALDNMEARLYVDGNCVKYEKPLLESGTMGTNGNVDTIFPFKTRTYADGGKAAEGGGVPMCTLRNFPQITDHCIEWSRDIFESLFVKLVKVCETYMNNPVAFEEARMGQSGADAIFETRSVLSLMSAISNPSIGSVAQVAFDLFHFLFRDKILDLQAAFPRDMRIKGENGEDKGPFWGEKKRYPTAAVFNPDDETHTSFLLSATILLAVAIGLIPQREESADTWLEEYRSRDFIVGLASTLRVPVYIQSPAEVAGVQGNNTTLSKAEVLSALFGELRSVASSMEQVAVLPIDFEKDDDLNFHISFITAAANLRCDNYAIKRTNFQSTKVIAGKIIAAIATTTAAVCGLVIFELFKVVQKKDTDAFMNRQIGLGTNAYTSFTQEPPIKFQTQTERIVPSAEECAALPADAFDEKGLLKEEYVEKEVKRAYPENHSVWDKIVVDGNLSLEEFSAFLAKEHRLKIKRWDFAYGVKPIIDENGKKTGMADVTSMVYPPKVILDYSLVPPLDLTFPQATQAIMKNPACKPSQQYINLWRECKEKDEIPKIPMKAADTITSSTTLKEILILMEKKGIEAEASKEIESRILSGVTSKRLVVIPSHLTPSVEDIDSFEEVNPLASIKIIL